MFFKQLYDLLAAVVRTFKVFNMLNGQFIKMYVDVFRAMIHSFLSFIYTLFAALLLLFHFRSIVFLGTHSLTTMRISLAVYFALCSSFS